MIAGGSTGTYAAALQALAREHGIAKHVDICENVSADEKHALYAAADIFVSPSDNIQESFGLALLEAMSFGLPVVAADWSGYRDIVDHGKTGFLVPTYWDELAAEGASLLAPLDITYGVPHYLAQHTIVNEPDSFECS